MSLRELTRGLQPVDIARTPVDASDSHPANPGESRCPAPSRSLGGDGAAARWDAGGNRCPVAEPRLVFLRAAGGAVVLQPVLKPRSKAAGTCATGCLAPAPPRFPLPGAPPLAPPS